MTIFKLSFCQPFSIMIIDVCEWWSEEKEWNKDRWTSLAKGRQTAKDRDGWRDRCAALWASLHRES